MDRPVDGPGGSGEPPPDLPGGANAGRAVALDESAPAGGDTLFDGEPDGTVVAADGPADGPTGGTTGVTGRPRRVSPPAWWRRLRAMPAGEQAMLAVDVAVIAAVVGFVLAQLGPRLLLADTTPAGGDMGAHVWGPAYLRDHLLPHGRLTGWAPDWYDGFPAYQFYMVVPALLIVAVNSGWQGWAALAVLAVAVFAWVRAGRLPVGWRRTGVRAAVAAVAVLGVGVPYGIAFKLVTVAGVLTLPLVAYAFGRLTGLAFPGPALLAVGAGAFLFNREPLENNTGNIIGGNMASTLAGEFSFSISLTFALLYLAVLVRGLRTGRHRALAAVLLALTITCHPIPAIFAAAGTVVAVLMERPAWSRIRWLATALPVGLLLAAFWALPFVAKRAYLNDMGWEQLPGEGSALGVGDFLVPTPIWPVVALAIVGAVLSVAFAVRTGIFLAVMAALFAVAFVVAPSGRLWNARLLPFWLLCLFLLAGIAVAEIGRAAALLLARDPERPSLVTLSGTAGLGTTLAAVFVALPLGLLPGGHAQLDGSYEWLGIRVAPDKRNVVDDWARWNYTGYERKPAFPEYHDLVATMADVGRDRGCGRALWEYESERLNSYGTPMAPMLLPYWTDGCIGSQEGLYFESSTTVPYHFINQSALSARPSRAQRFDTYGVDPSPYPAFDIELGVKQLQLLGVRYYLAFSPTAVGAADARPDLLTPVATSGPWHVYEVGDAEMVQALDTLPAVVTDVDPHEEWVQVGVDFFIHPDRWSTMLAADGPDSWARIGRGETPPSRPVDEAEVSNIEVGRDTIAFDVSEPGTPVLVKTSYFPNWKVSGAKGPYRVAPNLMVVVPTADHVELAYGWVPVDVVAYLLTLAGIIAALVLARRPALVMPPPRPPRGDGGRADDDERADAGDGEPGQDAAEAPDGDGDAWDRWAGEQRWVDAPDEAWVDAPEAVWSDELWPDGGDRRTDAPPPPP